jgi:hypothetical protein
VGIYARCWGAARHEVAEGIHRPLTLTCVTFDAIGSGHPGHVLISADLMSWRSREDELSVRQPLLDALGPGSEGRLMFCLAHTHAAPSVRTEDFSKPGGELIAAYQERLRAAALSALNRARAARVPAVLTWRYWRCDLATNRDFRDPSTGRSLCGHNPAVPADDTLLVGRITAEGDSRVIGTIVNYACHPTTLAWENRLISPDYVGAMREVVESETESPCCFLQGASGELAPAEQYTGDVSVADRHGRRLGHAVLSTLEGMAMPGRVLAYGGAVESGASLAVWSQRPEVVDETLAAYHEVLDLPLKPMPSATELEQRWRDASDPVEKERLWRRRGVRKVVGDGDSARVPLYVWRLGNSVLLGHPNEAYSPLQTALRARFSSRPVAVMNLTNGSAGYLPPASMYGSDAYAVVQTPFDRGSLERLISAGERAVTAML